MQYKTHEHSIYTHHDGRGAYIGILDIEWLCMPAYALRTLDTWVC